jgi:hypothetical protein
LLHALPATTRSNLSLRRMSLLENISTIRAIYFSSTNLGHSRGSIARAPDSRSIGHPANVGAIRFGLNLVILIARRSLPVYPHKQTISEPVSTSHSCQQPTCQSTQQRQAQRIGAASLNLGACCLTTDGSRRWFPRAVGHTSARELLAARCRRFG